MKRFSIMILLLVAVTLAGCSDVLLSPTYSLLLDRTQALSVETARRAQEGKLTAAQMRDALTFQSIVWTRFCNARDNIHDDELAAPTTQPTSLLDLVPVPK